MGDWAEWVQWADWEDAMTQTQLHFTSSFKVFQYVDQSESTLFSVRRDQCGTKKYFSVLGCDWLIAAMRMETHSYCATLVANKRKQSTFRLINMLKTFEWGSEMQLCLCNCIRPLSPFHPFRPVAHLQGSGPWCCSGAAYGRESNLNATVYRSV